MKHKVMDIFCGVGGFSKGFEKAGFEVVLGIDNWDVALETFQNNHASSKVMKSDIRELRDSFFEDFRNKIDVIIAGPPCQGFSMSGKRDPKDKRNTLFEEVIRAVYIIRPKIVIIENVVGILSMVNERGDSIRDIIIKKFDEIGYKTECRTLNAADFGVPQKRKRVIFIASRIGKIGFPGPSHSEKPSRTLGDRDIKKWVTVGDALGNIPASQTENYGHPKSEFQKLMSNGTSIIYNHEAPNHSKEIIKRMSFVPPGGNWKDIPSKYYNVGGEHSNNYRRLDPDAPSITIKHATKSMIIHPYADRCLTVREAARLQSFYDSFVFSGTKFEQQQQIANAVPPMLGFAIANHIMKKLQSVGGTSTGHRKEAPEVSIGKKVKFVDLFSGIGGFRVAMEDVGAQCIFSCDIDKWANETYFNNFGEWPKGDISKIETSSIPDHDILCAGFPCQPFSIAGRRLGFADTRGTLFFEVERILHDKKPRAFILENVRGLLNHDKGRTFETIKNSLTGLGYNIFYKILNAKDYGLPQNRERVFVVGFKGVSDFVFPDPVKLEKYVPDLMERKVVDYEISEKAKLHIKRHYKNFLEKQGISEFPTLVTEIRPSRCVIRNDGISPCLTAKMGTGGNNIPVIAEECRKLTERECLRLMGFPENFKIKEGVMQSYKQIGNSVPVPVVRRIAEAVIKHMA